MTFNETIDEALARGADIQGNQSIGFFLFPNDKFDRVMCENLIARLDALAKREGKKLNLKIIGGDKNV